MLDKKITKENYSENYKNCFEKPYLEIVPLLDKNIKSIYIDSKLEQVTLEILELLMNKVNVYVNENCINENNYSE